MTDKTENKDVNISKKEPDKNKKSKQINQKDKIKKTPEQKRYIITLLFIFIIIGLQSFILYDLYNMKNDNEIGSVSNQLKKINRKISSIESDVSDIEENIGTSEFDFGSVLYKLREIESDVSSIESDVSYIKIFMN